MTNCKDKCWCKKFAAKEPDADAPPLLHDLYTMAHKIDHLYNGVEKCFDRIEELAALFNKASKRPHKCPACDGIGLQDISPAFTPPHQCGSCEGKGILWG